MTELKDRAREYLAEHSEYSEVFGQTFVAVDTLTAMVEFAGQETKKLLDELNYAKTHCLFHSDCPTQKEKTELKSACDKTQELLDKQIEATYKLDVENAELRKDCIESEEDNNKLRENIYKIDVAKDLLLRFVELKNKPCASGHSINMLLYENICAETEQFLNSEVEK